MSLRFCLLLLSAVLSTLCVVAAQVDKHDPEKADSKPTGLVSSNPPVSTPTPWQSPVLADLKPTWEPQPTAKEPTESQPTVSPSPSLGQIVPKNARDPPKPHLPLTVTKCFANKNRKFEYELNYRWGKEVVTQLAFKFNDEADLCLNPQQTIDILRSQAPMKPKPSDLRTYCKSLGYYKGFMWAIDWYKRMCEICPFNGPETGFEAAMLVCELPNQLTKICYTKREQRGCRDAMYSAIKEYCPERIDREIWQYYGQIGFLGCWM